MPKIITCELCDFKCSKLSNYKAHLLTAKHQNRTFLNSFEQKMPISAGKMPDDNIVLDKILIDENSDFASQPISKKMPKKAKKMPDDNIVLNEKVVDDKIQKNAKKMPDDNIVLNEKTSDVKMDFTSQNILFLSKNNVKKMPDDNIVLNEKVEDEKNDFTSHKNSKKNVKKDQSLDKLFRCECGKDYATRNGLWYHKKKCIYGNNYISEENTSTYDENILKELVKQNDVFKEMMIDQNSKIVDIMANQNSMITTNNNVTNNTQNNNFNMNFFLNEQCKNAMNISDFLKTIQVEVEDVANVGKLGYVEGISRIFIRALNNLDIYERPIHCTDLKREVMYVKDNGIWEKEGEDKSSMKKALEIISHRNVMKIKAWTDANPSWKTHYSKEEDEYLKISYESMGGSNAEEDNKYFNKIIRKLASNLTIDKDTKINKR